MVISKHVRSLLRVFTVITLLVGCSGEPFGGPLWGSGGDAGGLPDGDTGSGGSAGQAGAAGALAGGQAGDAGSPPDAPGDGPGPEAEASPGDADAGLPDCSQCQCANQSGQWCGPKPPEPSSDLACSTVTPNCCVCVGHCKRSGCVYSPSNPIGGHTWMCCAKGL